ncbi:MAG: L-threonylcarbamoyladenylate synthase [Candidatus Hydrothermarchaeales archaeon]
MKILRLDEGMDEGLKQGVRVLERGGLVVYPTDTLYGLGCNALDEKAVRRVFEAKSRSLNNPLPMAVDSLEMMGRYALVNEFAKKIAKKFLPGPLTLVLKKKKLPDVLTAGLPNVAVRIPKSDATLKLIKQAGFPITATSANVSGRPPPVTVEEVEEQISVDLILDAGRLGVRMPSTILDLTGRPKILRVGKVKKEEIAQVLEI